MALPSIKIGSKACIPSLCKVGALFKRIGCSLTTSSRISQTSGLSVSTIFLADLRVVAKPYDSNLL